MRKLYCDKCGEEITGKNFSACTVTLELIAPCVMIESYNPAKRFLGARSKEFCAKCMKPIYDAMEAYVDSGLIMFQDRAERVY